jgi:hypothetical protein
LRLRSLNRACIHDVSTRRETKVWLAAYMCARRSMLCPYGTLPVQRGEMDWALFFFAFLALFG